MCSDLPTHDPKAKKAVKPNEELVKISDSLNEAINTLPERLREATRESTRNAIRSFRKRTAAITENVMRKHFG